MSNTIHALLIGINEYYPKSGLSNLEGCINDIVGMKGFLEKNYTTASIQTLFNQEATRTNIINTFQTHLCNNSSIQKGDTILFYFSGHGSYAETAEEFKRFDSEEQDETLVCYDSRLEGHFDLADKEIAVLLSKTPKHTNIVVILDSCHSASGTRSIEDTINLVHPRFTSRNYTPRLLNQYLLEEDDFYSEMLETTGKINIPESSHILLSACNRNQKAWETSEQRGLFSCTLLESLEKTKGNISYKDLFAKARTTIKAFAEEQTPQLEVFGDFNPNTLFLSNERQPNYQRHLMKFKFDEWRIEYGSINGLDAELVNKQQIKVAIYDRFDALKSITTQSLTAINMLDSTLDFNGDTDEIYWAEIIRIPPDLGVFIQASEKDKTAFANLYQNSPSPYIFFTDDKKGIKYELKIDNTQILIYELETGQLIQGIKGIQQESVNFIKKLLEHIREWETIVNLKNEDTRFSPKDVEIQFENEGTSGTFEIYQNHNITLEYQNRTIWYQIKIKNNTAQDLFVALFYLSRHFEVAIYSHHQKIKGSSDKWITLDDRHGLKVLESADSVTDIFKLVVSTEPFDDFKFKKEKLELGKVLDKVPVYSSFRDSVERPPRDDWFTHILKVNMVRAEQKLGTQNTALQQANITIHGHEQFKAKLNFASINQTTRNPHPAKHLAHIFKEDGFEILDFSIKSKGTPTIDKSIIELSYIENETSLNEVPLQITLENITHEDEYILPITFDGEHILPLGMVRKNKNGTTHISIDELPTVEDQQRQIKDRNPQRALWFCFLKLTKQKEEAFRLRYIWKYENGKPIYGQVPVKNLVAESSKILLLIHGIIGNTKPIAKCVQPFFDTKEYDLILTFDYENLHTKIEDIAGELNKLLEASGLGTNDNKQLDIIAHSMGGLVSRYLIERIREGDDMVNKLIMFGTPNGGSAFGEIPKYRDTALILLTIAANAAKSLLPDIVAYVNAANGSLATTKVLTNTLTQMSPEHTFIKDIYRNTKPKTQYTIVAGDIREYLAKGNKWAFIKNSGYIGISKMAYGDVPNDIAVSVAGIKKIKEEFQVEVVDVACHHLNYFGKEGLKILKDYL